MERIWQKWYQVEDLIEEEEIPDVSIYEMFEATVAQFPKKIAVIDGDINLSYINLKRTCDKFASALYHKGFKQGDRMAIMLTNSVEYIISFFAVQRLGGIVVQVNPMYESTEMEQIFQNSEPNWCIGYSNNEHKLKNININTLTYILVDKRDDNSNNLQQMISEGNSNLPEVVIDAKEDVAVLQYTGGTTGKSKGVMLTHRNIVSNVYQYYLSIKSLIKIPNERTLGLTPLYHVSGLIGLNLSIYLGGQYIVVHRFKVNQALSVIRLYQPTLFSGVPTMFIGLLNHPDLRPEDLKSLKVCNTGTAPMPLEVLEKFEKISGTTIFDVFGMSETIVAMRTPVRGAEQLRKIGSVGVPLQGIDARIVDLETGTKDVEIGEMGELLLKGPNVMKGYWKNSIETSRSLRNGWFHTGDIFKMDNDGYFYIMGRKKDMIIAGGFNIYPKEIEEVLYKHPKIVEACVYGVPDAYRGETVKAVIVINDEKVNEEDIKQWCRERLTRYKVPKIIEFRDSLPKSPVGKILRRQLLEEEKLNISSEKN